MNQACHSFFRTRWPICKKYIVPRPEADCGFANHGIRVRYEFLMSRCESSLPWFSCLVHCSRSCPAHRHHHHNPQSRYLSIMRATTHGMRVAASSSLRAFVPVAGGSLLRTAARTLPLATCARFASTLCGGVVRPTLLAARTTSNTMRRAARTAVRTHGLGHRGQAVAVHSYSGWSVRTWHRPFSSTSAMRSNASSPAATDGQAETVASVGTDETDPDGLIPILIRIQEIVKDDMGKVGGFQRLPRQLAHTRWRLHAQSFHASLF